MLATISHAKSCTIADSGAGVVPSDWNSTHQASLQLQASDGRVDLAAGASTAGTGTVSFADSNGVSFGLTGNTVTASVAGGGGGGQLPFPNFGTAGLQPATWANSSGLTSSVLSYYGAAAELGAQRAFSGLLLTTGVSMASSGVARTGGHSYTVGIYTQSVSTLASIWSSSYRFSFSISSSSLRYTLFGSADSYTYSTLSQNCLEMLQLSIPVAITLDPGTHWFVTAAQRSCSNASCRTAGLANPYADGNYEVPIIGSTESSGITGAGCSGASNVGTDGQLPGSFTINQTAPMWLYPRALLVG